MGDVIGHRRVFGVLVPYFNTVVEPELADLRPPGVTNQTARFTLDANVLQDVAASATKLATCGLDALLIGLSPEFIPGGLDLMKQAAADASQQLGRPVFTASHAVYAALNAVSYTHLTLPTN